MAQEQLVLRGTMRAYTDWVTAIATPVDNSDMIVTSSCYNQRFVGHTKDVLSVAFSGDNRQIVSASRDKSIKLWNTLGEYKYTIQDSDAHSDWVSCVQFSPNALQPTIVSVSWDRTVKIWNLTNCKLRSTLAGHTGSVNTAAVSPDGSLCASGGKDGVIFHFMVGVFMSSWLGTSVLSLGEWFIKHMPFFRHIYNASKHISAAISPDQNTQAFKEVAIIRHPRIGEYAFGFITSFVTLQNYLGKEELFCVYIPTNHLYIGDIFLVNANDVIRPNLSVHEGIEIVVSSGMSMPQLLSTLDPRIIQVDRNRPDKS
ncbi:Uncharacterized protein Fot_23978 [Forsythia ovata]|uniref:Uncharacterized protein n=1 Tax=Forsythia ovata TaxID=205694 RepID=A0ABD1U649_9LAMI